MCLTTQEKQYLSRKYPHTKAGKIKKENYIKEDIKMRNYVAMELKVLILDDEDVLTASAEFKDASTGDNGVWFPGSSNSKEDTWQ